MQNFYHKGNKGMTLAEVIVSVAIMMLIMGAIALFQYNVITYPKTISDSMNTSFDAQTIVKTIGKEMRGMLPGKNGAYPIVSAGTSTITFFADPDNNGIQDKIRYFLSGRTLYRGVTKPSGTTNTYLPADEVTQRLISNVRNTPTTPVFEYFGRTYTGSTTPPMTYPLTITAVRLVRTTLTLDIDPNKSPVPIIYRMEVNLRNLKDNL